MYNELKEGSIKETIYIFKRFFSSYSKIKDIVINKSGRNEKRIRKSRKSVKLLHQLFMILFVIRFWDVVFRAHTYVYNYMIL